MPDSAFCTRLFTNDRISWPHRNSPTFPPQARSVRSPPPTGPRTALCTSPGPANRMTGICPPRTAAPAPAGSTMPAAASTAPRQTAPPQRWPVTESYEWGSCTSRFGLHRLQSCVVCTIAPIAASCDASAWVCRLVQHRQRDYADFAVGRGGVHAAHGEAARPAPHTRRRAGQLDRSGAADLLSSASWSPLGLTAEHLLDAGKVCRTNEEHLPRSIAVAEDGIPGES